MRQGVTACGRAGNAAPVRSPLRCKRGVPGRWLLPLLLHPHPHPPAPPRRCYLSMTEQGTRLTSTFAPYIQMEVAVPFEVAGDCLLEVRQPPATG